MKAPHGEPDFLAGHGPFGAGLDADKPVEETPPQPPPPPPPPPPPHEFPASWLLDRASAPTRYRILTELSRPQSVPNALAGAPYTSPAAHKLMLAQQPDGTWGKGLLSVPEAGAHGRHEFAGIGTAAACHRLIEYGWDKDAPPLAGARRLLFRLLAEDDDPAFTLELATDGTDPETVSRSRAILRQAAAAVLAHAGYEADPRLRGAANRLLGRIRAFLVSPLEENPWVRMGGKPALSHEAFPPSYHALLMLAFMPHYRNENHELVDRLAEYLIKPPPRHEALQIVGGRSLPNRFLILGDPLAVRGVPDFDIGFSLWWLELMARLGILRRNETWVRAFDRLLEDRDQDFVWRPRKASNLTSGNPLVWPFFPLEGGGVDAASIDVTFRLAIVARHLGRPIDLV